jgi:hypothetical protein
MISPPRYTSTIFVTKVIWSYDIVCYVLASLREFSTAGLEDVFSS